jgi:hypothetical protein
MKPSPLWLLFNMVSANFAEVFIFGLSSVSVLEISAIILSSLSLPAVECYCIGFECKVDITEVFIPSVVFVAGICLFELSFFIFEKCSKAWAMA